MYLLGTVANFDPRAATPLDVAHQGTVFVAMDARLHAAFSGGTPTGEWVVSRSVHGDWPVTPWPDTGGWCFRDEAEARRAYQTLRHHVLSRLAGAQPHDDRGRERELVDPASAWGEAFVVGGEEAVYLSCDRGTEAKNLTGITDRLERFGVKGTNGAGAVYSTQTYPHLVAVATGQGGLVEHLLVAFTPGNEPHLVAAALPGSELDTEPFEIDVPSGILVLAWGRLDGRGWAAGAQGGDPAAYVASLIGNTVARALPTPWTTSAQEPHAWGIRVRPGRHRVGLRFLETPQGISGMAISHVDAPPLWPDLGGGPQVTVSAVQAAAAQVAAGAGGDPDPVVFPGQPLARLSDYVRLMKSLQTGDMNGALRAAGLDMASYAAAAGAWGTRMAQDPVLMTKYANMMSKP